MVSMLQTLDELSVPSSSESCSTQACLLDIDARAHRTSAILKRSLSLLGIVAALCDQFGDSCLQKTDHILRFAQVAISVLRFLSKHKESHSELLVCVYCCILLIVFLIY